MDIETFTDRDLRDTEIRDYTEKEAGARFRLEIKDLTEIINKTTIIGHNRCEIVIGNSHQLEQ